MPALPPSEGMPARLMLLLDSRSPAGAHSHSGGMEAAVTAGWVRDVADVGEFCRGRLRTSGRVAAAFAAAACRLWLGPAAGSGTACHPAPGPSVGSAGRPSVGSAVQWLALDAELSARTPSEAMRVASRALGGGLRRLLRATVPDVDLAVWQAIRPAPHHPLVLGAACALTGGGPRLAARAAALATCTGPASAAVRLLGLDPYAVHTVIAELGPEIDAIDHSGLPADGAPGLDLLADHQLRTEVRLFAS